MNLDHVTAITATEGVVQFWNDTAPQGTGPALVLEGEDAAHFLAWLDKRAASSLHG